MDIWQHAGNQAAPEITLRTPESSMATLRTGRVLRIEAATQVWVEIDGRSEVARRAASCLLEPAAGDEVLVACTPAQSYVLAILGRTGPAPASLSVDVPNEEVVLRGGGITVSAQREVRLEAAVVAARTRRFTVVFEVMSFVG